MALFPTLLASACLLAVPALHPRPVWSDPASFARWLVHESDYGIVATHHAGDMFGNVISISDGEGYEDSTGIIYTYIPSLDATYQDVMANPNVSISWSEMALAGGTSGGCENSTAENPPCGRLTIKGQLTKVPEGSGRELALKSLFARHPVMKEWSGAHMFEPFWLDPASITEIWVINMYGGAKVLSVKDYLQASSQRDPPVPAGSDVCSQCGHIFIAEEDSEGITLEDLPEDWSCPVCGAPKRWFRKEGPVVVDTCQSSYLLCHLGVLGAALVCVAAVFAAMVGCRVVFAKRHALVDQPTNTMAVSLQPQNVEDEEGA